MKSDVDAAVNELDLQHYIIEMYQTLLECDDRPDIIKLG